jgi:hypothetical protein
VPRLSEERGLALTEFALIAPVLMLLLLAMLDMGKAFNYWIDQTHLANQGARWAAVDQNPGATGGLSLQQFIAADANTEELRLGGTDSVPGALNVVICFPSSNNSVGEPVEVRVSTEYHWLPIIGEKVGASVTIRGKATMRIERGGPPTNYTGVLGCPA